jgi:drug/metabolite transporter (DMT)-like permease
MVSRLLNTLSPVHKAMLFAFIGYAAFAFSDVAVKILSDRYAIYQILCIAFLLAALLLTVFDLVQKKNKMAVKARFKSPLIKLHILRGFLNFAVGLLFVTGLASLQMATVYTLIFTVPFYAVLITAFLYGEKMMPHRWFTIALGFVGILIVVRPSPAAGIDPVMFAPLLAAVFAALLFTLSKSMQTESDFKMGFYPSFIAGILCFPLMIYKGFTSLAFGDLPLFLISGIGINFGIILVSKAYAQAPSACVAPFHYSQILWGLLFGYFVFHEIPDYITFIGASVVIGSGLFLLRAEGKQNHA